MHQTFARVRTCFKEKSSGLRRALGGPIFAEFLFVGSIAERNKMKLQKILTLGVATTALFALSQFAIAQNQGSQNSSQGGRDSAPHGIAGQGGSDDTTLEIAPQPGLAAPKPAIKEIPSDREFNPGEDTSSIDPNFRPGTENGTGDLDSNQDGNGNGHGYHNQPHARPYLGITVQYVTKCYNGGEEHGLEVLTIDPNSPAAKAGVQARSGMTANRRGGLDADGDSARRIDPVATRRWRLLARWDRAEI